MSKIMMNGVVKKKLWVMMHYQCLVRNVYDSSSYHGSHLQKWKQIVVKIIIAGPTALLSRQ